MPAPCREAEPDPDPDSSLRLLFLVSVFFFGVATASMRFSAIFAYTLLVWCSYAYLSIMAIIQILSYID